MLFVWLPVTILLWIIHNAFWGDVDLSSYFLAVFVIVLSRAFDRAFGYET